MPFCESATISEDGCGSITTTFCRIESEREPALQHGAAHLAGADQRQNADIVESRFVGLSS